ncbi:thymus-specific serine protease [Lampris incognitus]|uniref:thymus-specific serine protease n=1 Tax=Lampris incognitus TaxID=2546036 RepID=UPI0024B6301E|nr:thymus-specific serine protease [Lampris incognitus]
MLASLVHGLTLLLLFNFVDSGWVLTKIKERMREVQLQNAKQSVLMRMVSDLSQAEHVGEGKIYQPLNHFDRQNTKTFPQRFFINEAYWQHPQGPVFLYIGGEGTISMFSILAGHHVHIAKEHKALLVALEHRFYGDSINPDGLKTESLADLSSQQALADLAAFHQYISERFNLTSKNTWISFGGSYSGDLSAWFRGKFPHLIYGAIASSAPVRAKLDFSTYNKIIALSLQNEDVGGSDKCLAGVREAFATVEAAMMGGNASKVAKAFGCCQTPEDLDDQIELLENLADTVMGLVQYNEEWGVMSIGVLCNIMTNESVVHKEEMEAYDRFVKYVQIIRSTLEQPCLDTSHVQSLKDLMDTSPKSARKGARQWLYQTCTEFGFYQTCEDSSCPFSRMVNLQAQIKLCPTLFNISINSLTARIAFTNQYYGADHPRTHTRVLFVNGGIDPWHRLSVLQNGNVEGDKVYAIFIKDTAHCADMMTPKAADRPSLKRARQEIERHVATWLSNAARENIEK